MSAATVPTYGFLPLSAYQFRVCESPALCVWVLVRWRRTHRKKRIRKKWAKRYGGVYKCTEAGRVVRVGCAVYGCPHAISAIRESIK